ncbi:MAG: rod shape-determining protein RodA [Anaerolineaceae bacterium]|nr:rod shape-determining protein RodA [Anaerolineaceae bacterium]
MKREFWRHFDFLLFGSVAFLCVFGVLMIRSAIAGNIVLAGLVQRQIIYDLIGLVIIIGLSMIDYHYWASISHIMYIFMFLFLGAVFVLGAVTFGSVRWIETGLFNIQPSEFAKIVIILVLANYFHTHQDQKHDLRWIATSLLLTFGLVAWILLQPNLSTSIVIFVLWFALIWLSGLPMKFLWWFGAAGVLTPFAAFPFLEEYQQQRVITFLFPDPNARHGNTYNVDQALVTIGSGGWFGQGYGHSTQVQLRYLKVRHTDFIFSAMSAEFGFVGTVLILALIGFVIYRCFRTARMASDLYGALIAYGVGVLMFFQAAVNVGVNLNLIPVTGLTLPFISYGGSSLLSLSLGLGLVESVAARHKVLEF